jgi:hypothetical protein
MPDNYSYKSSGTNSQVGLYCSSRSIHLRAVAFNPYYCMLSQVNRATTTVPVTTVLVLLTRIPTIILTGKNTLLSIFFLVSDRLGLTKVAMARTITPIRTEARTTMMAVVHRHTHLPAAAAAALARSESGPISDLSSLD